ncbi:hypothetical protein GCM10022198_00170 [Klugiella xanthotipulae]|uniref:Uncharacterized protein n=1 Tax=Klugiella xanthotipulae TaxID=244735 RepID=A0A543I5H0_9MICO|nr:hypothetical protein [Klugiella xanthotipulae]TQM65842.1 hypothetical protein FB466_0656 [Klugiella xanthotipulae]
MRQEFYYDWRARFGTGFETDIAAGMSWNEAWDLALGILRDRDSHTNATLRGDLYPTTAPERAAWDIYEGTMNAKRGKNQQPKRIPRPWAGKPFQPETTKADEPQEIDPESAARRERIRARTERKTPE